MLTGRGGKDLVTTVGGVRLELPVILCPTGLNGLFHSLLPVYGLSASHEGEAG